MSFVLLLGLAGAFASPVDALSPVARDVYTRGLELEASGDWARAVASYRVTYQMDPAWPQALLDIARVLEAQGEVDEALAALDRAPFDADAVEAKARLLERAGRDAAALDTWRRLQPLRPEWLEVQLAIADAQRKVDPRSAWQSWKRYRDDGGEDIEMSVSVASRIARALHDAGATDDALVAVAELESSYPGHPALAELSDLARAVDVEAEARMLAGAASVELSPAGLARLRTAQAAFRAGDVARATDALEALTRDEPRSADAFRALSVVMEARGDIDAAVDAALRAEQLDPLDPESAERAGRLMANHFAGRMDHAAVRAYQRALWGRPSDPRLWVEKAEVELRLGRVSPAASSLTRAVALDPEGPWGEVARRWLVALSRPLPREEPQLPAAEGRPASVPADAWHALHLALAWQRRALVDADASQLARQHLDAALVAAPAWTRAVNLDASLRLDAGDAEGALEQYRVSLSLDPSQGAVWLAVADLEPRAEARWEALERAAEQGEPMALLRRAEAASAAWRLVAAHGDLEQYRQLSMNESARADAVEASIRARAALVVGGAALSAGGAVAVPWWLRRRRTAGLGLEALVGRAPRRYREIASVLAAIRHEVLKHHMTTLDAVADALDAGDDGAPAWAAERLLAPGGALARLDAYVADLETIGRESGVRLNLRYRDPVFGPLLDAAERLRRVMSRLERGERPPGAAESLREVAVMMNRVAYRRLGRWIRDLCVLRVDEAMVDEAWRVARSEFPQRDVALVWSGTDAADVQIYRGDLHDVLVNLFRNAIEASVAAGEREVGARVSVDEDALTSLERVSIRIADRSPRRLTTAQLRGRFLGRGLGLAVDLVTRAAGSLHVEPESGWSKAVVVRLDRVERRPEGTWEDT